MVKLRHLAITVDDPETTARFFEDAFGMKRVRKGGRSIHLSDGTVNVALLQTKGPDDPPGLAHFGIWAENFASAERKVLDAGAVCERGAPAENTGFYEARYRSPEGLIFDLTHTGWPGTAEGK